MTRNMSFLAELRAKYRDTMLRKKKEPSWMPTLPKKIRADIAYLSRYGKYSRVNATRDD